MSVRIFLVLLSVAVLTRAAAVPGKGKSVEDACKVYRLPICTRDYNPVCGSDGNTYSNECMLCLQKWENQSNLSIAYKGEC